MILKILRRAAEMGPRRTLSFTLGRFRWVRRLNRIWRGTRDHAAIAADDNDFIRTPSDISASAKPYSLKKDGLLLGLELSEDAATRLTALAEAADVISIGHIDPAIHGLDRIKDYNANTDKPVCLASARSAELDAFCARVARNPKLLEIVRGHIGGIQNIQTRVEWSLVVDADYAWREHQNQTVTYHYDVFDYNFVYAFFYLTPTDRTSGAHELILGSHLRKPPRTFLSSIQHDHDMLIDHYGADKVHIIEGPARTGFVEDTSCFHRARPAETTPRLAFQIRYT